ncbi:MAG: hypothetical protein JW929_05550 [Anaerolineales bacterium]|nr:hypothetical protein [Anaerolineales bacterium]
MSGRSQHIRKIGYAVGYWTALLLLSANVFITFLKDPGMNGYPGAQFDEMINGTASKPYVTRALVPSLVRLAVGALPEKTRRTFNENVVKFVNKIPPDVREAVDRTKNPGTGGQSNFRTLWWDILAMYVIACVLLYAFLLAFHFALRSLFGAFFRGPGWFADAVGLAALAALPPFFVYYNFLYDLPTLFFITLLLALAARRKWIPFLAVFAFACWNKETTILVTMVFALAYWRRPETVDRKKYWSLLLAQLAVFAVVRIPITLAYWNNPGGAVEYHFVDHQLSRIFLQLYSFADLFIALGALLLLGYAWKEKPRFLKIALTMAVPLLILATFFGFLDEYRAFYELFPVVFCLAAHTIGKLLDVPLSPVESEPVAPPA